MRPLADNVIIKRIKNEEKTAGGIIIPSCAQEKNDLGVVVSIGKGKRDGQGKVVAPSISVGDTVYFGKYAGTDISNDHLIIREDNILGIVEKE